MFILINNEILEYKYVCMYVCIVSFNFLAFIS